MSWLKFCFELTKQKNLISDQINNTIISFDFPEKSIRPQQISAAHIKANKLKASASEMLYLFMFFSMMFGSPGCEKIICWQIHFKIREIISILFIEHFHLNQIDYLRVLISEHHELYLAHYGHLKPKFHYLIHYPKIILNIGPLIHIWTLRFESKHHELKLYAQSITSRVYICKSLAIKQSLQFACRHLS